MTLGTAHSFSLYRLRKKYWQSQHLIAVVLTMLAMSLVPACKSETGLFVTGDGIPTFEIRRSHFDEVKVFPILMVVQLHRDNEKLPPLREDESKNKVLWKVVADPTVVDKTSTENLDRLEYGKVPKGFTQEVPNSGQPQPLVEGPTYEAMGP